MADGKWRMVDATLLANKHLDGKRMIDHVGAMPRVVIVGLDAAVRTLARARGCMAPASSE